MDNWRLINELKDDRENLDSRDHLCKLQELAKAREHLRKRIKKLKKRIMKTTSAGTGTSGDAVAVTTPNNDNTNDIENDDEHNASPAIRADQTCQAIHLPVVAAGRSFSYYTKANMNMNMDKCQTDVLPIAHFGPACSFEELYRSRDQYLGAMKKGILKESHNEIEVTSQGAAAVLKSSDDESGMIAEEWPQLGCERLSKAPKRLGPPPPRTPQRCRRQASVATPSPLPPCPPRARWADTDKEGDSPIKTQHFYIGEPKTEYFYIGDPLQEPVGKATLEERGELFIEKWEGRWPGRPPELSPPSEQTPGIFAAEQGEALRDKDHHANDDGAGLSMEPEFVAKVEATDAPT